jgi:hypothetical protein
MPPEELEANYVTLVASGATTWEALRATAAVEGWADVLALCDKHDRPKTATKTPPKQATRSPQVR